MALADHLKLCSRFVRITNLSSTHLYWYSNSSLNLYFTLRFFFHTVLERFHSSYYCQVASCPLQLLQNHFNRRLSYLWLGLDMDNETCLSILRIILSCASRVSMSWITACHIVHGRRNNRRKPLIQNGVYELIYCSWRFSLWLFNLMRCAPWIHSADWQCSVQWPLQLSAALRRIKSRLHSLSIRYNDRVDFSNCRERRGEVPQGQSECSSKHLQHNKTCTNMTE